MHNKIVVEKMRRCVHKVCAYCKGVSYEEFRLNDMLIEACVFNLGQIGELTTKLDEVFKRENPQVHGHKSMVFGIASFTTMRA